MLEKHALTAATQRFRSPPDRLKPISAADQAERLVAGRLAPAYAGQGVTPPYPTYPFRPEAFSTAIDMLPRTLLRRCDEHRRQCLATGEIIEIASFGAALPPPPPPPPSSLDQRFETLRRDATLDGLPGGEAEEARLARLLVDTLRCFALQTMLPDDVDCKIDADFTERVAPLHARLRFIHRGQGDRETHHCLRALPHNQYLAFQSRLKQAVTASGIGEMLHFRHLVVIRQQPPPAGAVTKALCAQFSKAGGRFVGLSEDELRTMLALQALLRGKHNDFEAWLKQRRPLAGFPLLVAAGLDDAVVPATPAADPPAAPAADSEPPRSSPRSVPQAPPTQPSPPGDGIPIGRRLVAGRAERRFDLRLALLRRHTAILAGAGSGKTVLLRRIVEEAALQGIPAIVLDPNNDLARLGDRWPAPAAGWEEGDADKADAYHRQVETVVWTPGNDAGNPLAFAPLPDFAAVREDASELQQAIGMAAAALAPLAGASAARDQRKRGVLAQALGYFALSGQSGLDAFVRLLSDLPREASDIGKAAKLAADMADEIRAAIATDPLLGGAGQTSDVRTLWQAAAPGRTRISVISLAFLAHEEARQGFVNQLQMALFAAIRRHPARDERPLGLYVMDEAQIFAPSLKTTACKDSTVALTSQARKFGLGMIFATQVPKNIDNKIVTNCTTHFYGKMNAPATIQAIQELMAVKGGGGSDIGQMKVGQFYFSTEGMAAAEKLLTPNCLSHHPAGPLAPDEVLARARASCRPGAED